MTSQNNLRTCRNLLTAASIWGFMALAPVQANQITVDFSSGFDKFGNAISLTNQQVVNDNASFSGMQGTVNVFRDDSFLDLQIHTDNFDRTGAREDMGLIFDSLDPNGGGAGNSSSYTDDPDLGTGSAAQNSVGNLGTTALGNVLIIQEEGTAQDSAGGPKVTLLGGYEADDEGSRPAGYHRFSFDPDRDLTDAQGNAFEGISQFGFDLLDVEESGEWILPPANYNPGTIAQFIQDLENGVVSGLMGAFGDAAGNIVSLVTFDDLEGWSGQSQGQVVFGNNSANRIDPIQFNEGVYEVVMSIGGSGAIDNLVFSGQFGVPEPGTFLLLGTGLVGLVAMHRRRNKQD